VQDLLFDRNNRLFLSVASVWEMQIKLQLGKLQLNPSLQELIKNQITINNLEILSIDLAHVRRSLTSQLGQATPPPNVKGRQQDHTHPKKTVSKATI